MTDALWQLGGWTMLHFLWLGTGVALAGAAVRFACRRAAPAVRYAVSLGTLAMLAALPLAIAGYLWNPAILAVRLNPVTPRYSEGSGSPPSAIYAEVPHVIDLAFTDPAVALPAPTLPEAETATALPSLATLVATLPWLWLVGAPLTFALLAAGLIGSERLRRTSATLIDVPAAIACERLRQALQITRRVSVAVCDGVAQPVLVGIVRPLILLPATALSGWTPQELEMVLMHELAHVRRWDNLVNLLQRIVESALFFHPAVWLISRQVRRDREECCDAVVVSRIEQPHDYAALLVSIAAKLQPRRPAALAAASAMADHPLAGRVRRILKLEDEPMWISRRTLGLTVMLPLLIVAAVVFRGAAADENPPPLQGAEQPSTVASGDRAQGGSPREAIRGGIGADGSPGSPNQGGAAAEGDAVADEAATASTGKRKDARTRKLTTPLPDTIVPSPKNISRIVQRLEKQGFDARVLEWNPTIGDKLNPANFRLQITVPEAMDASVVWEESPEGDGMVCAVVARRARSKEPGASVVYSQARTPIARGEDAPARAEKIFSDAEKGVKLEGIRFIQAFPADTASPAIRAVADQLETQGYKVSIEKLPDGRILVAAADKIAPTPAVAGGAPFPSLEEQKIADRAYKLLGIDFEPINADELARVKELGYEGGLRASDGQGMAAALQNGDVLVGLHVWPTTDLKALDAILVRDDLKELAPLKYRVIRKTGGFGGGDSAEVVTGRIDVKQDGLFARKLAGAAKQHAQMEALAPEPEPTPTLRYNDEAKVWQAAPRAGGPGSPDRYGSAAVGNPRKMGFEAPSVGADPRRLVDALREPIPTGTSWSQPPSTRAYLRIKITPTEGVERISPQDLERQAMNHLALAKSSKVLQRVLSLPEASELPDAKSPKELERWLAARMQVSFPGDGEIMEIVMKGFRNGDALLNGFVAAFKTEVEKMEPTAPFGKATVEVVQPAVTQPGVPALREATTTIESSPDGKTVTTRQPYGSIHQHFTRASEPLYLYDGKTFDDWRSLWKNELKTERRTEAIEALAAFGRAGYGKEAAEAILDVAAEYDFRATGDRTAEGRLHAAVIDALPKFPIPQWLPSLVARIEKSEKATRANYRQLIGHLLPHAKNLDPDSLAIIVALAKGSDREMKDVAISTLLQADPALENPETLAMVRAALTGEHPSTALLHQLHFRHLDKIPEQMDVLFHSDPQVQMRVRLLLGSPHLMAFQNDERKSDFATVMQRLLSSLDDPQRAKDHVAATRAIAAGSQLYSQGEFVEQKQQVVERLETILREGADELLAPALVALGQLKAETPELVIQRANLSEARAEHVTKIAGNLRGEKTQITPVFGGGMGGRGGGF